MKRTSAMWMTMSVLALGLPIFLSGALRARGQTPSVSRPTEVLRAIAIAVDPSGNMIVIDGGRIRKLTPEGTLRAVAGTGRQGHSGDGGLAVDAGFEHPDDLAVDAKGNIYVADNLGHRVRLITAEGKIQTVAGTGTPGYGGDGGPAAAAKLQSPVRIALDSAGNLYIADSGNARIRKVTTAGVISTVAGTGREGFSGDNGPANSASLGHVSGLAVDRAGNIYIGDFDNSRIRKVAATTGIISTIAGNGADSSAGDGGAALKAALQPVNLAIDSAGNLLIVEVNRIRRVTAADGVIRTVVGNGTAGFSGDGSAAASAQLRGPTSVTVDAKGSIFIADALNGRIRKVSADGVIATIAGSTPPPPPALMTQVSPRGIGRGVQGIQFVGGVPLNNVPVPPVVTVAPSGRPVLLETRLGMIPHAPLTTVKDCGHVPKEAAQTAITCIDEAVRGKSPFIASFEQKGIDSKVVIGLGGTAPESVVQVLFDSNSTGGAARVSAPRDCAEPKLSVAGESVQVVCK